VLVTQAARSPLLAARSLGRRFEVFSVPLDEAHRAAKALGGSLNDCYVAGVAGALGSYHERLGLPVSELRMAMPVSTREHADAAANRFAPSRVMVPVGPDDPAARFTVIHERLAGVRDEPALQAADSLAELLAFLPTGVLVTATRSQARTIDFATSNLRGSPVDLFVGGARILANYPMGPRAGCALNVTMLSYCGQLHMGLNIDPAAVTDTDTLLDCFDESFTTLLEAGCSD
jgi:diacylglycerol O-acyltransferase